MNRIPFPADFCVCISQMCPNVISSAYNANALMLVKPLEWWGAGVVICLERGQTCIWPS